MRKVLTMAVLSGALAFGLTGCSAEEPAADAGGDGAAPAADAAGDAADAAGDAEAACLCDKGKAGEDVWCPKCGKGYIGGDVVTECEGCFAEKTGGPPCPM